MCSVIKEATCEKQGFSHMQYLPLLRTNAAILQAKPAKLLRGKEYI